MLFSTLDFVNGDVTAKVPPIAPSRADLARRVWSGRSILWAYLLPTKPLRCARPWAGHCDWQRGQLFRRHFLCVSRRGAKKRIVRRERAAGDTEYVFGGRPEPGKPRLGSFYAKIRSGARHQGRRLTSGLVDHLRLRSHLVRPRPRLCRGRYVRAWGELRPP